MNFANITKNVVKKAKEVVKDILNDSTGNKQKPEAIPGIIDGKHVDNMVEYLKELVDIARLNRDNHPAWDDFESGMTDAQNLHIGKHYDVFDIDTLGLNKEYEEQQYIVENHIFTAVKVINGIITAYRPGFQWKPPNIDDIQLVIEADDVSKAFDIYSQNMGIENWYPEMSKESIVFGHSTAILYHCKNRDALGKEVMEILDPLAPFAESHTTDWNKAKYRGVVIVENKLDVKAHWENELGKKINFPNYSGLNTTEAKHWNMKYNMEDVSGIETQDQIERGLCYYIEYDDQTRVARKKEDGTADLDEKGNPVLTERKYPKGRLFVIFEDDLIYDGENRFEHGESMFLYLPGLIVDGYWLGMGYPHLLYELQRNINEAVTQINLNASLTSNPKFYYDADVFDDDFVPNNLPGTFDKLEGKRYLSGGQPIRRYEFGDNTGQAYQRYIELVRAFYQIIGIEEAVRGQSKSGDSGVKVQQLYTNAVVRFRSDVSQAQHYLLKPYAKRLLSNMMQYQVRDTIYIGENYEPMLKGVNLFEALKKLKDKNIELQLKLIVGNETPDQRTMRFSEVVQLKQLLPNSIPDYLVMTQSDNTEIVKAGKMLQLKEQLLLKNQAELAQLMPTLQHAMEVFQKAEDMQKFGELVGGVMSGLQAIIQQGNPQTPAQ